MKTNKNRGKNNRAVHLSQSDEQANMGTTSSQTHIRTTYESWFDKYQPIKNHIDDNASFDGCMFETYGKEVEFVSHQPKNKVWTLIDCEGELRICEGFHFVNRFGYFVSKKPAPTKSNFSIKC